MAKVLLVEDDNNLREIYEARLQAEGYDTVTASDGEQALVVAKDAKPDLVISDVMMPKISGFEMLDILRNTDGLKDVKVIMLTALGQAEDKTRADQLGADKYLVKSQVTLEDIVKTAHQLLDDTPAPAATDEPAAAPATPPANDTASSAVPVSADASSTAQETQAMQAQIDSFAAQPVNDPPAAPASVPASTTEPAAAPTPSVTPATDESADTAQNDQVMTDAVNSLSGDAQKPSDVTAVEVAPPAPTTAAPVEAEEANADDGVTPGHKKVIKPISDDLTKKPDINELLAQEEASKITPAPSVAPAPEPIPEPAPVDQALQVSPELQATMSDTTPAEPAVAPAPPTPPNVTEPEADPNAPNPNDIAL